MLDNAGEIAKRAGVLLDDPTNSVFTQAYLLPFIDQEWEELDVELERAGMQYTEGIAVIPIPAGTTDLSSMFATGQPLSSAKYIRRLKWKLQSLPDSYYADSELVTELDEVDVNASQGATEYRFADGALQVTPSAVALTLKVYFDRMSTNVVDGNTGAIRGVGHILAARVATVVDGNRKGMEKRMARNQAKAKAAWNAFNDVLVKTNQRKRQEPPSMHGRMATPTAFVRAPQS